LTSNSFIKRLVVAGQRLIGNSGACSSAEQGAAEGQNVATAAISQESELAKALEAAWENMQQEATAELVSCERHVPLLIATGVVFPAKSNVAALKGQQPVIGDGDAVRVAAQLS
jgi:hypothetical protein